MGLRIAVFGSGAVLMGLEILGFRFMGKTFGSALRETTAVIAVFLASMSCGYYLGGRLGDRRPRISTLILPMAVGGLFILLVPTLDGLVSERISMSSLPLGLHAILASTVLFVVPSMLLASVSPITIRLLSQDVQQTGKVAGSVSALSTVGSIFGTVLTGFYLIDALESITRSAHVLGVAMLILSAIAAISAPRKTAAAAALAIGLYTALSGCAVQAQTIFERDSSYHHIAVRDVGAKRILYFENSPESQMDRANPIAGGFEYTDFFHCAYLFNPNVKDVLCLGLGGGTAPKRFLHDYPNATMDVVDVDPLVVEVAEKYFAVKPNPRLHIFTQDGRVYVKRCKKQYDLVILDAYTTNKYGSTVPPHLTTREFMGEVKKILRPGGVIAYNVTGLIEGWGHGITQALVKTIGSQFDTPYLFQAISSSNTVILAFKDARHTEGKDALVRKAQELVKAKKVKLPNFERRAGQLVAIPDLKDAVLLTDDYSPVDKLMREN